MWVVDFYPYFRFNNPIDILKKPLNIGLRNGTKRVDLMRARIADDGASHVETAIGKPPEENHPGLSSRDVINGPDDLVVILWILTSLWVGHKELLAFYDALRDESRKATLHRMAWYNFHGVLRRGRHTSKVVGSWYPTGSPFQQVAALQPAQDIYGAIGRHSRACIPGVWPEPIPGSYLAR
jgi:hypothetical protein